MPPQKMQEPGTPDQKIRKALFMAKDRLENHFKDELHSLIDDAPAPIIGREATENEIEIQNGFRDKAREFLLKLPPEVGITYESLMQQVDAEMANRKSTRRTSETNGHAKTKAMQEAPISPRKNGKPRKRQGNKKVSRKEKPARLADYLCLLDLMATCNDGPPPKPQEIIEFPAMLLNVETGKIEGKFHCYVCPDVHPILSSYCTELTGITQHQVESGISLLDALGMHQDWLDDHGLISVFDVLSQSVEKDYTKKTFLLTTCGDWDLRVCLANQLAYHGEEVPASFQSWANIKWPFENMYHRKVGGIADMLDEMGLQPESSTNNGLDDCLNLARICQKMIDFGWVPNPTAGRGRIGTKQFWQVQSRRPWPPQRDPLLPYKMVILIRHGQAEAELVDGKTRSRSEDLRDCGLTEQGVQESKELSTLLSGEHTDKIELVVTSPMKRALHTSLLAFPNHRIVVNYDLAEIGRPTPENSPKPMEEVLTDLEEEIEKRKDDNALDYKSRKPEKWPRFPENLAPARRVHDAFEWLYTGCEEQTIAVVCHSNVIRTGIYGAGTPVAPDNAAPIRCQLFMNGNLVPI